MVKKKTSRPTKSRRLTGVRLDPTLVGGLNQYKQERGVPIGTQVEFAVREWLDRQKTVPDYVQQKLWEAVFNLVGVGSIRQRVNGLGVGLKIAAVHHTPAFPHHPDLQEQYEDVLDRLSRDSTNATDSELEQLARDILNLFAEATALANIPAGAAHAPQRRR